METMAIHAASPPPERIAPSIQNSVASSPRLAANLPEPEHRASPPRAPTSGPSGTSRPTAQSHRASSPISPIADLAPLPTSFDPDASPPPLHTVAIDDELAIKPREEPEQQEEITLSANSDDQVDPAVEPPLDEEMQVDPPPPEMQEAIQAINYFYGGEDSRASSPLSPPPLAVSPIADLPSKLLEEAALPPTTPPLDDEFATDSPARARRKSGSKTATGNGKRASSDDKDDERKKRKAESTPGPDGKRVKSEVHHSQDLTADEVERKGVEVALGVRDGPPPPERTQPRQKAATDNHLRETVKGRRFELQVQPCLRPRYEPWGKCVQCIAKVGGDSCRFRGYRQFPLDPGTSNIIGKGTFPSTELMGELTPLPRKFNTTLTEGNISKTEQTVAPMLLNLITTEMRHVMINNAIRRPVDSAQHRAVCDFCAGTIFAGFWFCTKCGRDYCIYCERYVSESTTNLLDSPWPIPDQARTRLQRCSRGDDSELPLKKVKGPGSRRTFQHSRNDFLAVSRFSADELRENWTALVKFVLEPTDNDAEIEERIRYLGLREDETELANLVREWFKAQKGKGKTSRTVSSRPAISEKDLAALYDASKHLPRVADPAELESHPFMFLDDDQLDDDLFDQLWARGEPMVIDNVSKKFILDWSPDEFIRRFGPEQCYVLDCETERVSPMSIGQFFTCLKDPTGTEVYVPPPPPPKATPPPDTRRARRPRRQVSQGGSAGRQASAEEGTPGREMSPQARRTPGRQVTPAKEKTPGRDKSPEKASSLPVAKSPVKDTTNKDGENGSLERNKKIDQVNGHTDSACAIGEASTAKDGEAPSEVVEGEASNSASETTATKANRPRGILKLKDWPATNDFSEAYPDLYEDFCRAVPAPDYTRRDGVMNLYAHFPKGATRPDIGPKMYCAFEGKEGPGGHGSTRLHMDVADAVNIMLYAAPREDGSPGCAVWDLFRAEDADLIRAFLSEKFSSMARFFTDPIHSQMFYLDSTLRKELFQSKGVKSFRVYQYPGQAVFIPAGCAHQVCNLAPCTKIALDFVSPHNVKRCQRLTQDFRKENFTRAWKDDVLQLYNVMWYAWTNVRETRERRAEEAAEAEAARAAVQADITSLASGTGGPSALGLTLRGPQTSSVRDDPAPSPRDSERGTPAPAAPEGERKENGDPKPTRDDGPPAELVRKLMDAALSRQLQPIPIESVDRKPSFSVPPSERAPSEAKSDRAERDASRPPSYREMHERGHLPLDRTMAVMRAQMGQGMDVDE